MGIYKKFFILTKFKMGGASSTSEIKKQTHLEFMLDQSVFNDIRNSCAQSSNSTNVMKISGSNVVGSNIEQKNIMQSLCILKTALKDSRSSKGSTTYAEKLSQDLKAEGGLPGTNGSSQAIMDLYTKMSTKVDQSTINKITSDCILDQKASNVLEIENSGIFDSGVSQLNQGFADCLMKNDIVNNIDSDFQQNYESELKTKAYSSGILGGAAGISASISTSITAIVILVVVLASQE
jgi:hypothetical protein